MRESMENISRTEIDRCISLGDEITNEVLSKIMSQREEILTAFIAKYGCSPNEITQVVEFTATKVIWTIERKKL